MAAADDEGLASSSVGAEAWLLGPRRLRRAAALHVLDAEATWWAFRAHASLCDAVRDSPNAAWKTVVSTVNWRTKPVAHEEWWDRCGTG